MKRHFIIAAIFGSLLQAQNIETIVKIALQKNNSLHAIQKLLKKMDIEYKKAKNWKNPTLKISINDLRLDRPFSRDLEPMQTQQISITQKIPTFGKKEFDAKLVKQKKQVIFKDLEVAKNRLAFEIFKNALFYQKAVQKQKIVNNYIHLVKQSIDLYSKMLIVDSSYHLALMQSKIFLSDLKTTQEELIFSQTKAMHTLSYLTSQKITRIDPIQDIKIDKKTFPHIEKLQEKKRYKQLLAKRYLLDEKSDINLNVGYFQRANFDDYISIGISISLPLYGTEKLRSQEAKIEAMSIESKKQDVQIYVQEEIAALYEQLKTLQTQIALLQQRSLKEVDHSLDLVRSRISSGDMLYKYLDTLKSKFAIELKLIDFKIQKLLTKAKINYLNGAYK
ncbi:MULTISPECIES: TolC family protein [unclassified Nitratiruptor]|uniref:TolC family protein n=1 Tax=unclassified Nitratiruptor TaxID=2624044 RepID=UPI0019162943|nr:MULTISPECIES: TolC family protein [unclassified Nitratiruptor]BCD60380.1 heavy metal RND efflux outer membrane protein, CzcC family [Nitratiruptor sp. YY08-10]BCD64131.1 heavy metal RND efflux outer membrane protein, CzcC family [Nitratiruptor sp. YY08-14]